MILQAVYQLKIFLFPFGTFAFERITRATAGDVNIIIGIGQFYLSANVE
jgi:hypothetical protein